MGLSLNPEFPQGDDFAEASWQDLRRVSVGVFDLSFKNPQLFHDLGIALTLGMEVMLIAKKGTIIPFDISQDVRFYSDDLKMMYDVIAKECRASGIKLIRGDMADEQQIVNRFGRRLGEPLISLSI